MLIPFDYSKLASMLLSFQQSGATSSEKVELDYCSSSTQNTKIMRFTKPENTKQYIACINSENISILCEWMPDLVMRRSGMHCAKSWNRMCEKH
jgi:hypothetical protein